MTPDQLAAAIVGAMRRFGYRVFANPGELNLVYVEGANEDGSPNGNAPNRFNDRRILIRFESGVPKIVGNWEATSEPVSGLLTTSSIRRAQPASSLGSGPPGA